MLSFYKNQGHLVYSLDDSYIHMATAKNFSQYSTWGVTRYEFSSSSSSLGWPLLLSLTYSVFGVIETSPFVLNLLFAIVLLFFLHFSLLKHALHPLYIFVILCLTVFLAPLPTLCFHGQEHILHVLVSIIFACYSARILLTKKLDLLRGFALLMLSWLLVMARFEGLFLVFVVCCLFLLRKKVVFSFVLGAFSLAPVIVYGFISISRGAFFLPNSLLLKSKILDVSSMKELIKFILYSCYYEMIADSSMLMLFLAALLILYFQFRKKKSLWDHSVLIIIIFVATTFLHMQFARSGIYFRYEAYLVVLGIFALAAAAAQYLQEKLPLLPPRDLWLQYLVIVLIVAFCSIPLVMRATNSLINTPRSTTNIYEQQYQMGLFLKEFYKGKAVAANDIGAVNFLADVMCLDLVGLASTEVTRAKMEKRFDTKKIQELVGQKKVKVAIVYEDWFKPFGGLPRNWIKVGKWKIKNNVACGGSVVTIFAVDNEEKANLIANLRRFSARLPKSVEQSGLYMK